ncbi:MAG: hypothetical protein IJR50_06055 [Treponema sp.]|nr:hypothetical protein [Treponema sp.]
MGRHSRREWKNQNAQRKNHATDRTANHAEAKAACHKHIHETIAAQRKNEDAIRELKARHVLCTVCGKRIEEMSSAIADNANGNPAHFDCILKKITNAETLGENEKVAYIGQGRFGILHYENPRDVRSFKIVKTIEWEGHDSEQAWRSEMSSLYSQVL